MGERYASMKGGRTAPRNEENGSRPNFYAGASMKGGRTAPRNTLPSLNSSAAFCGFNEGGADCPPKQNAPENK